MPRDFLSTSRQPTNFLDELEIEGSFLAKFSTFYELSRRTSPWIQLRGKWMVSSVNSHTNATRIGWHLWEIDLRFAHGLPPGWSIWRMIENPMSFGSLIIVEATFGNCPGSTPAVIKLMVRSMVKSCASTPSSFSVHASTRHSHQPAERDQTAVLTSLGLHWSSPESGDLWYKSGGSKETIWSRSEGWWSHTVDYAPFIKSQLALHK